LAHPPLRHDYYAAHSIIVTLYTTIWLFVYQLLYTPPFSAETF